MIRSRGGCSHRQEMLRHPGLFEPPPIAWAEDTDELEAAPAAKVAAAPTRRRNLRRFGPRGLSPIEGLSVSAHTRRIPVDFEASIAS